MTPSQQRFAKQLRAWSWRCLPLRIHRWLSLGAAVFWLVQAGTGVLCVFHWEAGDALISRLHRPTDLHGLEARVQALDLADAGRHVESVWTTAGLADRYDIAVTDTATGKSTTVHVAGDGTVLGAHDSDHDSVFDVIVTLHQTLFSGDAGSWIVGFSGLLLISNVLLGVWIAIPRRGGWRIALIPARKGTIAARLYSWHRTAGLIVAIPAVALFGSGTLLVFETGIRDLLRATPPQIVAQPSSGPWAVGFAVAAKAGLEVFPGSRLTAVEMPTQVDATYAVHVLADDDIRRAYGTSIVFIDAMTGAVHAIFPAHGAPPGRAFVDGLYTVHTGEIGGLAGRFIVLGLGFWLLTMLGLGLTLWVSRRKLSLLRAS